MNYEDEQQEEMYDEQRETEKKDVKTFTPKVYDEEETLPDLVTDRIVRKEDFAQAATVTIKKVLTNKFGKPAIVISSIKPNLNGQLSISASLYMELKERFGPTPRDWKGKSVTFKATYREFQGSGDKPLMKGWEILLA